MAKIEDAFEKIAALSGDERDVLFDLLGAEDPVDMGKVQALFALVLTLGDREKGALLDKLDEAGLLTQDDEDEDEDEDEDDEEGEEDGDDSDGDGDDDGDGEDDDAAEP